MNREIQDCIDFLEDFFEQKNDIEVSASDIAKKLKCIKQENEELFLTYLKKLPNDILGDVVLELPDYYLKDIVESVPKKQLKEAIEELESDDATDLIQDIEEADRDMADEIFSTLDKEDQEEIKKLKRYDDEQAGAYMQTEVFTAAYNEKIQDSIGRLKQDKMEGNLENIHHLFIVDSLDRLMFSIGLEDLILFDFSKTYKDEIKEREDEFQPKYVEDDDEIDEVVHIFEDYDLSALAVVDGNHKLVGRITADDVHDIIQESATEQIYGLAGVDDEAEHEEDIKEAAKSRVSWLFVNLLTAILASIVIGIFDNTIHSYVALAVLMPIVASMGGNAGTQTLTIMVRQLALGEIDFKNAKNAIKKELILSTTNGVIFGVIMGVIAYFWFGSLKLSFVISSSMLINLLSAGITGATIPLMLKKLGIDPAIGSTVLLTTFTDIIGFFSFLGLATLVLV
ncbi:MAG: magnesium transporter [Epsilonproteobacteria bacterium]|nr:magnesium transporter [Campylobacterota bacterium]